MDAGVPISRPVAGIAMGLMSEPFVDNNGSHIANAQYKILTDIQGPEDHFGDMDFKVAGTSEGVTGVQMDVKVAGIPISVLTEAFVDAKKARLAIIDTITKAIPTPRTQISAYAPEIIAMHVKPEQIGLVIGPGGKTINGIREETKVADITIEDDGSVFITGKNGSAQLARDVITALTREFNIGDTMTGKVTRIEDFGCFVSLGGKSEGMVHISELAPFRVNNVKDIVSLGETVPVQIIDIDERKRIRLSIKSADADFAKKKGIQPPMQTERPRA
jgi:polyribonucleotide nucleotidyltransferase